MWTFIKNNWKGILIVTLGTLFLFSLLREPKVKVIEKDNTDLVQELKQYKDRNGSLVSEVTQVKLDKAEVDARVDSLARELNISKSDIKTVDRYITKKDTQWISKSTPVYYHNDTAYKVSQKDQWLSIEAIAGKDTGSIKFSLRDTLDRVEKDKSGIIQLLGFNKGTNVYLRTKSPYIDYKEGYSITVKEKETWLTIGPSVQYDLLGPNKNKVTVGVSAQIPLIKIKK